MTIHPPLILNPWCSDESVFSGVTKNKSKTALYFSSKWSASWRAPVGHKRQPAQPGNCYAASIPSVAKSAALVLLMFEVIEASSDRF